MPSTGASFAGLLVRRFSRLLRRVPLTDLLGEVHRRVAFGNVFDIVESE
jgi:hypothetical protein